MENKGVICDVSECRYNVDCCKCNENKGVICDVSECRYNVDCCKCNLPQIKVTEHCASGSCSQQVENPHFCQSYEKK